MQGTKIIVTSEPKGHFEEGYITGTPKPGTVMQIDVSEAKVGGKFHWEVYAPGTDGNRMPIAILLEKRDEGKIYSDAYVTGDWGYLYFPLPGEEFNMLVKDVSGTGTTEQKAVGDLMIVDDSTGKLIDTTGDPESEPFMLLEAQDDPISADTWLHCLYTGY